MADVLASHERDIAARSRSRAKRRASGKTLPARVTFIAAGRHRRRRLDGEPRRAGRASRTTARAPRSSQAKADGVGHLAPLQPHDRNRHAVRRGAGVPPAHRVRPPGAAADRGAAAGGVGPAHDAGRARGRAGRRRRRSPGWRPFLLGRRLHAMPRRPVAWPRATCRSACATTSATNWARSRGCSTTPCANWRAGRRNSSQDRARTEAILAGMVEGVIVDQLRRGGCSW